MKKADAISYMNLLGARKIPFLFIIDFEMRHPLVFRLDTIDDREIVYDINGRGNGTPHGIVQKKIVFTKQPVSLRQYRRGFNNVMGHLRQGNTYLLNLTFPTAITTNLTLREIFIHSRAKYKLYFKNRFVVFSPETFVTIRGDRISAYPMKGTIDAAVRDARRKLLSDPKELAEHYTIVDLIRNDLNMIAKNVRVTRFRYLEKIRTHGKDIWQASSEITGKLPKDYRGRMGDIIFQLLPAGSISGAPKKKTVEIIKQSEPYRRGYYTGIFGYFDGTNLDSGVMIRFIERKRQSLVYKSGGGITSLSDMKLEYQEMIDKVYVPII
jgi:para-aminobenzoate synthetase component 1